MDIDQRIKAVRRHKYCLNCLARTHTVRNCDSTDTCLKCRSLHHTLLHQHRQQRASTTTVAIRDRLGERNGNARRVHSNANHKRKQQRKRPAPVSPTNQPDQRIISEAIRSLAAVLCSTSTNH